MCTVPYYSIPEFFVAPSVGWSTKVKSTKMSHPFDGGLLSGESTTGSWVNSFSKFDTSASFYNRTHTAYVEHKRRTLKSRRLLHAHVAMKSLLVR